MALKIRVTATHWGRGEAEAAPVVYRAEAYEEDDGFREPRWGCAHDHDSVEHALNCGHDWLDRETQLKSA